MITDGVLVLRIDPKISQDTQVGEQEFIKTEREQAAEHSECCCMDTRIKQTKNKTNVHPLNMIKKRKLCWRS
jgi:hypothetical protein